MAVATKPMKACPYCKEKIREEAVKCRYCYSELPGNKSRAKRLKNALNTFRTGFLTGVVFMLLIVILFYHHFN